MDDGKSTLIGRLLYDSKQIFADQLAALATDSKHRGADGQNIDLAQIVDGLAAEREQGITIDAPTVSSPPTGANSSSPTPPATSNTRATS